MTPDELARLIFQGEMLLADGLMHIEDETLSPEARAFIKSECEKLALALGILHGLNEGETIH
jgi:hypothetical protein